MVHTNNFCLNDAHVEETVSRIVRAVKPEMIICYGLRKTHIHFWSCFFSSRQQRTCMTYDLLIVTREGDKRPAYHILDSIDRCLKDLEEKVNVLVHNVSAVNEAVSAGNLFFTKACREGVILYERCEKALVCRLDQLSKGNAFTRSADIAGFEMAKQFRNGALHFSSQSCNKIALFMLHQAMEHTCNFLVRFMIGYRPSTHNLSRLLAMMENFSPVCSAIFPANTPEEKDLFDILARAYSDVRYREGFDVAGWKVLVLIDRVTFFQRYAQKIYESNLGGIANGSCPKTSYFDDMNQIYENS